MKYRRDICDRVGARRCCGSAGVGAGAGGAGAAGGGRPGRRRCAARSDDPRRQGRGQVLGAGPVGAGRRRTRFIGDSAFTVHADIPNQVIRVDWDRDMKYVAVERLQFSEIVHRTYGFVDRRQGTRSRCRAFASPRTIANTDAARRSCCCGPWTIRRQSQRSRTSGSASSRCRRSRSMPATRVHRAVRPHDRICPPRCARATTITSTAISTSILCSGTGKRSTARRSRIRSPSASTASRRSG